MSWTLGGQGGGSGDQVPSVMYYGHAATFGHLKSNADKIEFILNCGYSSGHYCSFIRYKYNPADNTWASTKFQSFYYGATNKCAIMHVTEDESAGVSALVYNSTTYAIDNLWYSVDDGFNFSSLVPPSPGSSLTTQPDIFHSNIDGRTYVVSARNVYLGPSEGTKNVPLVGVRTNGSWAWEEIVWTTPMPALYTNQTGPVRRVGIATVGNKVVVACQATLQSKTTLFLLSRSIGGVGGWALDATYVPDTTQGGAVIDVKFCFHRGVLYFAFTIYLNGVFVFKIIKSTNGTTWSAVVNLSTTYANMRDFRVMADGELMAIVEARSNVRPLFNMIQYRVSTQITDNDPFIYWGSSGTDPNYTAWDATFTYFLKTGGGESDSNKNCKAGTYCPSCYTKWSQPGFTQAGSPPIIIITDASCTDLDYADDAPASCLNRWAQLEITITNPTDDNAYIESITSSNADIILMGGQSVMVAAGMSITVRFKYKPTAQQQSTTLTFTCSEGDPQSYGVTVPAGITCTGNEYEIPASENEVLPDTKDSQVETNLGQGSNRPYYVLN